MLKKAHAVAGVLEFVNVGPDLSLPPCLMRRRLSTAGTARVQSDRRSFGSDGDGALEFEEDAAHFFDFLVYAEQMLVAEQVSKAQPPGFGFGFGTVSERAIFGPKLVGGVARHPKGFDVRHCWFRPGFCEAGPWLMSPLRIRITWCNFRTRAFRGQNPGNNGVVRMPRASKAETRESFCRFAPARRNVPMPETTRQHVL